MNSDTANALAPILAMLAFVLPICWVIVTRMKIKNGYPLENAWGKAVYPKSQDVEIERIKLLSQENAQLRAELGSVKDRLANVERIVTDGSLRLSDEIEALRAPTPLQTAPLQLVKERPE